MTRAFENRSVVVTGGGRGIGRAIAEAFADQGAKVVIGARTASYGEEAVAAITASGGQASLVQVDISDKAGVFGLIEAAVQRHGGLDIVVHSAADIPSGGIDVPDEAFERGMASIVKASFWLTQAARPHLRTAKGGGRMIFISSICGPKTMVPGRMAYGVAKAGLDAFIRGAALELAREKITVNGIEPGLIASARAVAGMGMEVLNQIGARSPVGRPGTAEEIAHTALFLASPLSGFITGTSVVIDGGSTLSNSDPSAFLVDHQKRAAT